MHERLLPATPPARENFRSLDLTPLLLRPLASDCPGSDQFALVILRKIDAMGSKFTADSPWNLINPTKESEI